MSTPNKTPPTQNFQEFFEDENENIHIKIKRSPADFENDDYDDSRKASSIFQYFKENRISGDPN